MTDELKTGSAADNTGTQSASPENAALTPTGPEPEEMLDAVYNDLPSPAEELASVKNALEPHCATIKAYGIYLTPEKIGNTYYASGHKRIDGSDCAALGRLERVSIHISRKYQTNPDGSVTYTDSFQLTLYKDIDSVVQYYSDNAKEGLNQAFNKLLQMRDLAYVGWPVKKPSRCFDM